MNEQLNYETAYNELQEIVSEISNGSISIDAVSDKVKRAAELIRICKEKLKTTEEDINAILQELDTPATESAASEKADDLPF